MRLSHHRAIIHIDTVAKLMGLHNYLLILLKIKWVISASSWYLATRFVSEESYELLHSEMGFLCHHVRLPYFTLTSIKVVLN